MNSPLGNLFLSLQALIAGLADGSGKKYFSFVDQDMGQLDAMDAGGRFRVSWPCVLIDIDEMHFDSVGENVQQGKGAISLRLGFPPFSSAASIVPDTYREKALYYYDLEQVLHNALQGSTPSYIVGSDDVLADVFGAYDRVHAVTERRRDTIRVRELRYSLGMSDYSTGNVVTFTPAALDLTEEVEII